MTFVVDFDCSEKLDDLVRAGARVHDEVRKDREQLNWHREYVGQQNWRKYLPRSQWFVFKNWMESECLEETETLRNTAQKYKHSMFLWL